MQRATGLQFYSVIAHSKLAELHICTNFSKCKRFQVTNDITNTGSYDNLEISYYSLNYGIDAQVTHHVVAVENTYFNKMQYFYKL